VKIINSDTTILSKMSLTGATDLQKAQCIIKRNKWDDLIDGTYRICIYHRPSRGVQNLLISGEVVQVDVHSPSRLDYVARQIQERIRVLLHKKEAGDRML